MTLLPQLDYRTLVTRFLPLLNKSIVKREVAVALPSQYWTTLLQAAAVPARVVVVRSIPGNTKGGKGCPRGGVKLFYCQCGAVQVIASVV